MRQIFTSLILLSYSSFQPLPRIDSQFNRMVPWRLTFHLNIYFPAMSKDSKDVTEDIWTEHGGIWERKGKSKENIGISKGCSLTLQSCLIMFECLLSHSPGTMLKRKGLFNSEYSSVFFHQTLLQCILTVRIYLGFALSNVNDHGFNIRD